MYTIYESIQALCDQCGITPGKMCAGAGVSRSILTDLKTGRKKSINTDTAQKIADYFGVSVDRVLGNSEQKEKPTLETKSELNMDDVKLLLGKMSSADLVELMGDIAAKLKERGGE